MPQRLRLWMRLTCCPATTTHHRLSAALTSQSACSSLAMSTRNSTAPPPRKRQRSSSPISAPAPAAAARGQDRSENAPGKHAWPAPATALRDAERFILKCARAGEKVLLVPDKDADGLSAGAILYRTLRALGLDQSLLAVHLMSKGNHPGTQSEREAMQAHGARWIIVLDQGSREGPALVDGAEHGWDWEQQAEVDADVEPVRTMVLDHHFLPDPLCGGPQGALMVNASHSEPVATTALLTWHLCRPLLTRPRKSQTTTGHRRDGDGGGAGLTDEQAGDLIDWLCLIGTMGDLSVNVKFERPFPDMSAQIKRWTKKKLGTAVALLNAPRRTPTFDTITAWRVLLHSNSPASIADGPPPSSSTASSSPPPYPTFSQDLARLFAARAAVAAETERCTHTPPKFSRDGRVALLRIRSAFQVHPSIATRWSGTLRGAKKLEAVMCANDGYSDGPREERAEGEVEKGDELDGHQTGGVTHFSCRIAQAARSRGEEPNLIELLHDYAARDPTFLRDLKNATESQDDAVADADVDVEGPGNEEASQRPAAGAASTSAAADLPAARISVGNFARGHRQASGGIIPHVFFERFVDLMEIGVKDAAPAESGSPSKRRKRADAGLTQSNTLMSYFKKV